MLKIREIQLEKGLSVTKLSVLSGIPCRAIQDLEKRGDCMQSTAIKLATAMEVSLNDIWEFQNCQEN